MVECDRCHARPGDYARGLCNYCHDLATAAGVLAAYTMRGRPARSVSRIGG